jgi:enoyl-CoA hydratase
MTHTPSAAVRVEKNQAVTTVILSRKEVRNAVDKDTAQALADAFADFDKDPEASVAVLYGEGGTFCAGADLKAVAAGRPNRLAPDGDGPMGPSRMRLGKPVIAAISGHAVAGGLELACFCDLRVAEKSAVLGVFCRRVGVPLIDGGTVRLPQIVGLGRALDLILTGRAVGADEALAMGLVNRVVPDGMARIAAEELAAELARLPQTCLRSDRDAVFAQLDDPLPLPEALSREFLIGLKTLQSGESVEGATRFSSGAFRHGGSR